MQVILWVLGLIALMLAWTGISYAIHRLAHVAGVWNQLHRIHRAHHHPNYLKRDLKFRWYNLLFCFETIPETLDVWITLTLPAFALSAMDPEHGIILLCFHYIYEILLSDNRFDHNPAIGGQIIRWLACGQYHLEHHRDPSRNFGLLITFWDFVFRTNTNQSLPGMESKPKDRV